MTTLELVPWWGWILFAAWYLAMGTLTYGVGVGMKAWDDLEFGPFFWATTLWWLLLPVLIVGALVFRTTPWALDAVGFMVAATITTGKVIGRLLRGDGE